MSSTIKKILFLTGTRADFGKLKPLMHVLQQSKDFEVHIFATGMHMLAKYGTTVDEIHKAGFKNIFKHFNQMSETSSHMDMVLANTVAGLGHYVREFPPDLLVVHGDRVEALAGAIVGALNGIRTAHVEGGEISGTVDELMRHAVTKLAHIHFTANEETKKRLLQLGEKCESIFIIGSPDIDTMLSNSLPSLDVVKDWYEIPFNQYSIVIYHPVQGETHKLQSSIQQLLRALIKSGKNFVIIHPNNDTGADIIIRELESLKNNDRFRIFPSMRFESFLILLKNTQMIIGNSSSGIHEAPVYGVPTVNIGSRQKNRFMSSSICNVPEDEQAISEAISNPPKKYHPNFYFGKGNSAELFVKTLCQNSFWNISLQKQFIDVNTGR